MLKRLGLLVAIAGAYFVAGKLGLRLAFFNPSATPVWAPTGIALAALLIAGYDVWPAILVGAFFVNLATAGSVATSLGIAVGNALEGLVGAYLVNRFARGRWVFERARNLFRFILFAAVLSTAVSATIGVTTISLAGMAGWADYGSVWLTWWLGDVVGDLVIAPALILWIVSRRVHWNHRQALQALALLAAVVLVGLVVFGGILPAKNYPLEFLCVPLFLWAAFAFGPREAVTAVLVLSGIAIWGTLHGLGPFRGRTPNESLLLLQAFVGVTAVMTLTLAVVVTERKEGEERLRLLAVSDPLTGLANYRRLTDALEAELRRSNRTDRPFAVVLLDLDGLKKVNDRHGHLVGSRALCRVAEILHGSCRGVDTAARFGGDEFAVVLPETGEDAAWHVARRVAERVARDGEQPAITVSVGVAVHPRDGASIEALLSAADQALYKSKARRQAKSRAR
jgi:diguanylate cyclase (GGDEF)-like protein